MHRLLLAGLLSVSVLALASPALSDTAPASRGPNCPATPAGATPDPIGDLQELRSVDGHLDVTLVEAPGRTLIGGAMTRAWLYNGQLPGPVLRVCPGDLLRVRVVNRLAQPTNLHVHGMHVSPLGRGDDVLRSIGRGRSGQYEYRIPRDQPGGLNWYHPHRHMFTDMQLYKGLAGMLVVDDPRLDDLPALAGIPERLLQLQVLQVANGSVVTPAQVKPRLQRVLVNGVDRPTVRMPSGAFERWRVLNASADMSVRLRLRGGGGRLALIGRDGNPLTHPQLRETLLLLAGQRAELLVRGPRRGRRAVLETTSFKQPFANTLRQDIVRMVGSGPAPAVRPRLPRTILPFEDLSHERVDRHRRIVFTSAFPSFYINGRKFDHHRVDQVLQLGQLEEWKLVNGSGEWHSFHLHQDPVQVVAIDGRPVHSRSYEDTVAMPPWTTVTIRFRTHDFVGKRVFHCHLLDHEDRGMMSLINVVRPKRG